MSRLRPVAVSAITLIALALASGDAASQAMRPGPSGRASTTVTLNGNRPPTVSIDYGVPHARGRTVNGALPGDLGTVWRLGANEATTLRTEVDLTIGTLTVPKGSYTLAAETNANGNWKLIVNTKTGQWGIPYDASTELGRTPLTSRTLSTPIESLTMWLIPAPDGSAGGDLRFAWGTREFSVRWQVRGSDER